MECLPALTLTCQQHLLSCFAWRDLSSGREAKTEKETKGAAFYMVLRCSVRSGCASHCCHVAVQVADFGISHVKDPQRTYLSTRGFNGTGPYMAPEQLGSAPIDEKVSRLAVVRHLSCQITLRCARSALVVHKLAPSTRALSALLCPTNQIASVQLTWNFWY